VGTRELEKEVTLMRAFGLTVTTAFALAALAAPASATDSVKKSAGQELFEKYKCQSCHSIATLGIEKKKAATEDAEEAAAYKTEKRTPPDLSAVGVSHKADWMAAFLMKKEKTKEGKLHTKKFKGTDEELKKVTAWLETLKDAKAAEKANAKK
jgi:mono/diheme cytochrome c family protein